MFFTHISSLPNFHKRVLLLGSLLVGASVLWPVTHKPVTERVPVALDMDSLLPQMSAAPLPVMPAESTPHYDYLIAKGDTLSSLFSRAGINQQTMYQVLEADLNVLALDTLMPDNRIKFWLDNNGELQKLELYFSPARQVVFTRFADGSFNAEEIVVDGLWQNRISSGEIRGSFYVSAQRMGLSAAEITKVESLLKEKLNFSRDLRAGDTFSVLANDQYVEGVATGASQILGIQIKSGKREITAFQHSDGNFYDAKGNSLAKSFQRIPLEKQMRLTSHFNSHRKHPVTGRVAPHNGTDFGVPIGTKVVAPGDGVVTMVTDHQFAGKYVVIEHGNKFKTRYLHLSKSLVKKGDRVSRGQVIALSGNTGRSTGPHLHYEFHVNGRPVDPMKVSLPTSTALNANELSEFISLVRSRQMLMNLG
ncbi:peptidoglycan DD-metalloendopeptidase family protein [Shewanella sp. JM162201]|uniref:Peptidoglycan DD-metalloendopeptidase family protein n=1 Tax=Shewanella jiangmenensis TaxID=2837387 RepID=A0ABS5UYH3_9GAMM|nr:peptidoglycan DD-metalloendopeptidase family protein [Shewanella jiangmenensis]MBT1443157.1 peptidoglycan DD-metalloendopeptidase family protein [Shewanella jiangmenensis]